MMDLVLNKPSTHMVSLSVTRDELSTLRQAVVAMQGEMRLQGMCDLCDMDQETVARNAENLKNILSSVTRVS